MRETWLDHGGYKGGWKAGLAASGAVEYYGDLKLERLFILRPGDDIEALRSWLDTGHEAPCEASSNGP